MRVHPTGRGDARTVGRYVQYRAGHGSQRRTEPRGPVGGQLIQDRLTVQGAEQEMGDQLGVGVGPLRTGRLDLGDTVLVTAGAGAIGHLAVQLAKRQGAGTVIATAGSPAKLDFLKELGADVAFDHTRSDWASQVRAAAPGGIDMAMEAVGGEVLHQSIGLLAPFGRVVAFGASASCHDEHRGGTRRGFLS